MLRYLRENTGNWIIKIFLGIIVIVFVFLGVGSFNSNKNNSVATINDEVITIEEYKQAYRLTVDRYRARFGNNLNEDLLKMLNVKQQALDGLIDQRILLNEADKLDIVVTDKELQDNLLAEKAFQKNGQFDLELYKAVLNRQSFSPEIFEKMQIENLRREKLINILFSTVNISDMEAKEWYTFQNAKIAVDYLLFAPAAYSDIEPDDTQVEKYYTENKDKYKSEQKLKAVYLKFSPTDHSDEVNITDKDVQASYEQQLEKYKVPEKVEASHILIKAGEGASEDVVEETLKRAQDVYQMALKGQDFEELAKQYSEGPSKSSGGYLGKFEKKSMVKPFADKAFSMKAGEVGEPIRTTFGWHIIKVLAKFDASIKPFEQVSSAIKKELELRETQNLAYDRAGEAFDAVIDGDDFEQVARIVNKKIQKTKAFAADGQGLPVADNKGFANEAFSLAPDAISDVKQLGDDYFLIKVVEKIDPDIQKFDQVKEQIKKELVQKLRNEKAKDDATKAVAEAVKSKNLVSVAKEYNLDIKSTKLFSRNSNVENIGNLPEFIQAGFSLTSANDIYPEIIESNNGYYILGFKEKKVPETLEIEENLKATKNELNGQKKAQSFQAWIGDLKKQYKINYDPNIVR